MNPVAILCVAVGAGPEVLHADLDDFVKALVVLLFFFGPALKALLDRATKASAKARGESTPGSKPQASGRGPAPRRQVTWEDLMRGDVPEPQEVDPVEPQLEARQGGEPAPVPLAGAGVFGDIPGEDELERQGADGGALQRELDPDFDGGLGPAWSDPLGAPVDGGDADGELVSLEPSLHDTLVAASGKRPATGVSGGRARHWLQPDDWRRSIVLTEVLGPPLAMRERWSHPGPPASTR